MVFYKLNPAFSIIDITLFFSTHMRLVVIEDRTSVLNIPSNNIRLNFINCRFPAYSGFF